MSYDGKVDLDHSRQGWDGTGDVVCPQKSVPVCPQYVEIVQITLDSYQPIPAININIKGKSFTTTTTTSVLDDLQTGSLDLSLIHI